MTLFTTGRSIPHLVLPVDLTFPYWPHFQKNNSHPSLSKTGTFFEVPPKHQNTHTTVVVFVSICKEYIWANHSYFLTPTPKKRQRILWEIELFMKCESIESILHFVQKQANNQPATLTQAFPSIPSHLKESPPRWISTWVGMRCQVMAMEVWFGVLLGFLVGSQHHETPRALASWSRGVRWIFKMGFLDVFFFWWMGFW